MPENQSCLQQSVFQPYNNFFLFRFVHFCQNLYSISVRFCRFKCHTGSFIKVNCTRKKQQQRVRVNDDDDDDDEATIHPYIVSRMCMCRECPVCRKPICCFLSYLSFSILDVFKKRILIASIESKQHLFDVHHCSNVTHLHCIIS